MKGRWAPTASGGRPILLWALWVAAVLPARAETVRFKNAEGAVLAADYRAPRRGQPVFVLLHGLGAGRGEWRAFQARAAALGWGSLAVDMRGHGESGGQPFAGFKQSDWAKLEGDGIAAVAWLGAARHIAPERVVLGGASIGANLALHAAASQPRVPFVLLLSPGWNYQGVTLPDAVASYAKPILFAAAPDDPYAFKSSGEALRLAKRPESLFLRAGHGHGVAMLDGDVNKAFAAELFKCLADLTAGQAAKAP